MLLICCSFILLANFRATSGSRIPADFEYQKQLDEYYRQHDTEYRPLSPVENVEDKRMPNTYGQDQYNDDQQKELTPDEIYEQRLREYYENIRKLHESYDNGREEERVTDDGSRFADLTSETRNGNIYGYETTELSAQTAEDGGFHRSFAEVTDLQTIDRDTVGEEADQTASSSDLEYQRRLEKYYETLRLQGYEQTEPTTRHDGIVKYTTEPDAPAQDIETSPTHHYTASVPANPEKLVIDYEPRDAHFGNLQQVQQICPEPVVSNGQINFMDAQQIIIGRQLGYTSGSFGFTCNPGFGPSQGSSDMTVYCQEGQLTQLPQCEPVETCYGTPSVFHGQMDGLRSVFVPGSRSNTFGVGTKLHFSCNQYAKPEQSTSEMISECLPGGRWSKAPRCTALPSCDFRSYSAHVHNPANHLSVAYTNVTLLNSPLHPGRHNVMPGSIVQHKCIFGYEPAPQFANSNMQVRCNQDGNWSPFPTCHVSEQYRSGCASAIDPSAILANYIKVQSHRLYQIGGKLHGNVTFQCVPMSEPISSDQPFVVTCSNGQWTELPKCRPAPMCKPHVGLPYGAKILTSKLYSSPTSYGLGYLPGSYVEYLCDDGLHSRRSLQHTTTKVVCHGGGEWVSSNLCSPSMHRKLKI